jgi:hypothetical protein
MNLNFINPLIGFLRGVEMTPMLMLILVLGFIMLLIFYYMSGLSETIENLSFFKKTFAFIIIAAIVFGAYYVFYKAGQFDELLGNPTVRDLIRIIKLRVAGKI